MVRCKYANNTITRDGLSVQIVPNAEVTVYEAGTTDPLAATLYAGPTGGTTLTNPHFTDADGNILFYLDAAQDIKVVATGVGMGTLTADFERVLPATEDLISRVAVSNGTDPTLTLQNTNNRYGLLIKNEDDEDVIKVTKNSDGYDIFCMNLQNGIVPAGSNFLIAVTLDGSNPHHTMADFDLQATGAVGDVGTSRFSCFQTAVGAGTLIRTIEAHVARAAVAISPLGTWCVEFGTHSEVPGVTDFDNAGVMMFSSDAAGAGLGTSVEADSAFVAVGNRGWDTGFLHILPDNVTAVFRTQKTGRVTAGDHYPLAADLYALGTATLRYNALYSNNVIVTNAGSAAAPTNVFVGDTTSGGYLIASGRLGRSVGGVAAEELSSTGLTLEKTLTLKPLSDPAAPASGQWFWTSTDGYSYAKTSAGLIRGVATNDRERFIGTLLTILGDTRLLWLPKPADTTTSLDESLTGRTLTYDATIAGRLSRLGMGQAVTFNGTSQYATTPDAANLSFGNGTVDQAFSIVALANITDTAGQRMILSKYGALGSGTGAEWELFIHTTDQMIFEVLDDSAGVACFRNSDAAIAMGAPHLYVGTYSGVGGATAANGMVLYQDGVAIASSVSNNASYVAMEDKTAAVEIGSRAVHASGFMNGSMMLVALCQKQLSAPEVWAIKRLVNEYFSLAL